MGAYTFGSSTDPNGYNDTTVYNLVGSSGAGWAMPQDGLIDTLEFYFGPYGATGGINFKLVLVNGDTNTILGITPQGGTGSALAWRSNTLSTPVFVTAGTHVYVALLVAAGTGIRFGVYTGSGTWLGKSNVDYTNGATLSGGASPGSPYVQGYCGHRLQYNLPGGYAFDSSAFQIAQAFESDGTTFQTGVGSMTFDGAAWQNNQ